MEKETWLDRYKLYVGRIENNDIDFEIKTFKEIPEDFIKYVKNNIIDYDMAKHENWYFITT